MERPDFFSLKNGDKAKLAFTDQEYKRRLDKLRNVMSNKNLDAIILTSMHNIAYYTGFIYCSFGRFYGCVITKNKITTISANIDASQPWRRSICDNVIYTDWKRDNFFKAIVSIKNMERMIELSWPRLSSGISILSKSWRMSAKFLGNGFK